MSLPPKRLSNRILDRKNICEFEILAALPIFDSKTHLCCRRIQFLDAAEGAIRHRGQPMLTIPLPSCLLLETSSANVHHTDTSRRSFPIDLRD